MLNERNFGQYIVKKFVRREREFFVNEDGQLEKMHDEILKKYEIKLANNYQDVLNDNNIDFGIMRIRNGTVELFEQSKWKGEEARKETIRILTDYSEKAKVKVVNLSGIYDKEYLESLMVEVRPIVAALILADNAGKYHNSAHIESAILKEAIRFYTKNCCSDCGKKQKKIDIHHIIPQEYDGPVEDINNLIGICGTTEKKQLIQLENESCHQKWQKKVDEENIIFPGFFSPVVLRLKDKVESDRKNKQNAAVINSNLLYTDDVIGQRDGGRAY
jgi:hypothetical protein